MQFKKILCGFLLLLLHLPAITHALIISIDFGSEFFKVALVKSGVPMEVVLNPKESKRKTENILSIDPRNGFPSVGAEASGLSTRFPHLSYPHLQALLGRSYEDPTVRHYEEFMKPIDLKINKHPTRNTVVFNIPGELHLFKERAKDSTDYISVEEMVAIVLRQAKSYAEHMAKDEIKYAVITVPRFFTIRQRIAMMDAARLAGLHVLELTNEDTAVAIQFALSRDFSNRTQHHIFFDVGSGSATATLVRFSNNVLKSPSTNSIIIDILGFENNLNLNGKFLDKKLQHYLASAFKKSVKGDVDITKHPRAMVKLLKEAKQLKEALTMNTYATVFIENLWDEQDLKVTVTRQEFEDLIRPIVNTIQPMLDRLMEKGGMTFVSIKHCFIQVKFITIFDSYNFN
jgi:hypoxia up-regulated 1